MAPERIVIVGTTGSGKSMLARRIAAVRGLTLIELDALYWEPGWQEAADDEFRRRVAAATAAPRWVLAGNYSKVRDLTWEAADTVLWLDYPFIRTAVQLITRTVRRVATRELLWGTNRETVRRAFLSRQSILVWLVRTHGRNRARYPVVLAGLATSGTTTVRLRSPRATNRWVANQLD